MHRLLIGAGLRLNSSVPTAFAFAAMVVCTCEPVIAQERLPEDCGKRMVETGNSGNEQASAQYKDRMWKLTKQLVDINDKLREWDGVYPRHPKAGELLKLKLNVLTESKLCTDYGALASTNEALARYYDSLNRFKEAEPFWLRVIELARPNGKENHAAWQARLELSDNLVAQKQLAKAEEQLRLAIEEENEDTRKYYGKAEKALAEVLELQRNAK